MTTTFKKHPYPEDLILISADRQDEEPWRIVRLMEVDKAIRPSTRKLIARLHDDRGDLTVTWLAPFTHDDACEVLKAWNAQRELNVNHTFSKDVWDDV
jgi:hypothetical protein